MVEIRRGIELIDAREVDPGPAILEIERLERGQKIRLGLRQMDRLRPKSLPDQLGAPGEPDVDLLARFLIFLRKLRDSLVLALVAGHEEGANFIDDALWV